jgi:hypothetical protein
MSVRLGSWNWLRLLSTCVFILGAGCGPTRAARLDPAAWKIFPLTYLPAPTGLWATNPISLPSGTNQPATSSHGPLTNLTDNNPSTLVTLSNTIGLFVDLGQTNVIDRVFLIGGNHRLNLWPDSLQNQANPPLGLITVSIGNDAMTRKQVGTWTVPYDAGNPVDTEVDLRFSPTTGRYVQIQLQTNTTWGVNYWPGYALPAQPPAPTNLTWNIGEVELYGFRGPVTNLNAVVCDSFTNTLAQLTSKSQPLQIAALDLSYYLGELTGRPHPIITSAQTNRYPGSIYRIVDLASLAPDYNTMMSNIALGKLPTNLVVSAVGREVHFSGWPYRCVLWGVWEFLERQGIRWVYPDGHGDFIPSGSTLNLNILPLVVKPSAISIYANFDCPALQPWPDWKLQSVRQEYLYPWRNRWNRSWNNYGPLGGAEIPKMPSPGITVNSNFTEGFVGYPHNFSTMVPMRILDIYTNWWGWTNTTAGSAVKSQINPTFIFDDPTLIFWVAQKMTNIAAAQPLASTWPLNIGHMLRAINLLPLDACVYSQDPYTIASNGPAQPNPEPWVKLYRQAYSGAYYSFVTAVADQARQMGYAGLVGALAYADVFPPPTNIPVFPDNVQVEVCLYGAPNLPMNDPANAGVKAALDRWHSTCAHLATYDYALLHTDYWEQDPRLPVPLVAGAVARAKYLASSGALDGGCQGNITSLPYNPWNFYAYPRIRWNTNQTASQLETEFFNGYFREAAAPMLACYQALENYQVTNGINMHYQGYAYGITPGAFPLSVLNAMQNYLAAARQRATNWYVKDRVANIQDGFNWVITNAGLAGVSLTNTAPYPVIGTTTDPYTVNLTNLAPFMPAYSVVANSLSLQPGPPVSWWFGAQGQIHQTFNVAQAGTYTVAVRAYGVNATNNWPTSHVYWGPKSGSMCVNTTTESTYSFNFTLPAGVWDFTIIAGRCVINQIQVTRQ